MSSHGGSLARRALNVLAKTKKVKVHIAPTPETLALLAVNDLQLAPPSKSVEEFLDTNKYDLLRQGCSLRRRINLETKEEVWCFQETLVPLEHFYEEKVVTEEEAIELLASKLNTSADLQRAHICSTILARFLTFRYQILSFKAAHLDDCYFDIDGEERYTVISCSYTSQHAALFEDAVPARTKLMEHICRFSAGLCAYIPEPLHMGQIQLTLPIQQTLRRPEPEELVQINPGLFAVRQRRSAYIKKLVEAKRKYLPGLLNQPKSINKWAVIFAEPRSAQVMIFDTQYEAFEGAEKLEPDTMKFYVVHITHDSLNTGDEDDGDVLVSFRAS